MKLKAILSALLALTLLCAPLAAFTASAATETLTYAQPAIPADVGDKIDLTNYAVQFVSGKTTAAAGITWKLGDEAVTSFTPDKAGVTELTAEAAGNSKSVYVVAKEKDSDEYVLYLNTFDDESSYDGIDFISGSKSSASIEDGKLIVNALSNGGFRFLLPSWLGSFGDYRIDLVSMVSQSNDNARWQSIMYRVQNNSYPYYQMCIRKDASVSNGVEFAIRTPEDQWNVVSTGSYVESQKADTYYTHTVEIKDNTVMESINGTSCVYNAVAKEYKAGRIGVQVNYSTVYIDSVKVSLQLERPAKPAAPALTVTGAEVTNILNSFANSAYIDTADDLATLGSAVNAVLRVSGSDVIGKDGTKLFALSEAFEKIGASVIPVFSVEDTASADAVIAAVPATVGFDYAIMSKNKDVVKYARQKNSSIRGIIDFTDTYTSELTDEQIAQVRLDVNGSLAKVAALNISCLTKENVLALESLLVNVWACDGALTDTTGAAKLIALGSNGVLTDAPEAISAAYSLFGDNAMTRTPLVIGHRGNPTNAPENTISGYLLAIENGADVVETDIYLSADNEIVIMHDGDISRTSTGSGNIESMTLEQIKQYNCWGDSDKFKTQFPDEKIPTLREMFEALKDSDAKIFIEIKSSKTALCRKLTDLIKEFDYYDRVCVISFNASQLVELQKTSPQMSCGFLLSGPGYSGEDTDAAEQLYTIIKNIQPNNTTYNPNYANQSKAFIDACNDRGVSVWPWTYSTGIKADFCNAFRWGYNGLTTNDCQMTKDTVKLITADKTSASIILEEGKTASVAVSAKTYGRAVTDITKDAVPVIVSGDNITVENGVITASAAGSASVMFKYSCKLPDNSEYVLFTSPVEITVTDKVEVSEPESEIATSSETSEAVSDSQISEAEDGLSTTAIVCIIAAAVIILAVAVILIIKKRK